MHSEAPLASRKASRLGKVGQHFGGGVTANRAEAETLPSAFHVHPGFPQAREWNRCGGLLVRF
jgi:hypothetical protein